MSVNFLAKPAQGVVTELWGKFLGSQEWLRYIGSPEGAAAKMWIEQSAVVVAALVVVLFVTFVGMLSRYFFGKLIIQTLEKIIDRVPVIKSVYSSIKQIVATFGSKNKENFKQVVLVQFPHPRAWTVAFVTNRSESELSESFDEPVVHVFVPTTPNPTGGYFLIFRESDVRILKMSVADGMKLVVSGGSVLPASTSTEELRESDGNG
ncbi:MAG: DUF502 domain-containing protein [Puniceicoccales bacterium]|nr:DUF502 domain-containing protein [Puniceicoccales bacterium]